MKSVLQQLRAMLAKQGATAGGQGFSASDWDAFLGEALQRGGTSSEEARERQEAIAQIMKSADIGTKISIADCLLFADDVDEAQDAIIMRDQQRRKAA